MPAQLTMIALVKANGFYSGQCEFSQIILKGYPYGSSGCYGFGFGDNVFDGACGVYSPSNMQLSAQFGNASQGLPAGNYIQTGKWYFCASSYDGNTVKYYQVEMDTNFYNPTLIPFHTKSGIGTPLGSNNTDIMIGHTLNPPFPYWFNGSMDEVILFNKVLTDAEIQSVYHYLWGDLTVTTNDTLLCGGAPLTVSYTILNPDHYEPGNVFTAQLSDASGSFASPVNIGSVASVTSGSISCIIPPGTPAGTGYRVRVEAGKAHFISKDNGVNIKIGLTANSISLGNDTAICDSDTLILKVIGPGTGAGYLWNTGSTASSIAVVSAGTYWVKVSLGGCEGSDTINIVQNTTPDFSLGNDTTICEGDSIILLVPAQPAGSTYLWNTGSTQQHISVGAKGQYSLTVSNNGCTHSDAVGVNTISAPSIYLGNDTTVCYGQVIQLPESLTVNGAYEIVWQDGSTNKTHTVREPGIYFVRAFNICGSVADTIEVAYQGCHFWFPSAFTPDGNNLNDKARMRGGLEGIEDFELHIYNRWGNRVYHSTDKYAGWDGTYKGVMQSTQTFFYMIRFTFNGEKRLMKGDLTLVR